MYHDSSFRRQPSLIACLYGFWLSLDPVFSVLVPVDDQLQNGVFLAIGAGIALFHMLLRRPAIHAADYGLVFFGGLSAIMIASMLVNTGPMSSATQLFLTVPMLFVMYVGLLVASEPFSDFLSSIFMSFAIGGACSILYYIWLFAGWPPNLNARLAGSLNPNSFGMICAAVACASLAVRFRVIQVIAISVACFGLYLSQSRSNIAGVAIGYAVIGILSVLRLRGNIPLRLGIVLSAAVLVFLLLFNKSFADFVYDDLLQMHDRDRGLSSGATGRTILWVKGIELWKAAPMLGYGYRANEAVSNVHNGYIAVLLDLGVIGLVAYLMLVGVALKRALHAFAGWGARESVATIALLVAYSVMAMFERFALNSGNAASILVIIACFRFVAYPIVVGGSPPLAARRATG